ncbi:double-strand break repair helicase AddA [Swingsia samuiensis]|uniref:DNA 3'-5' helicase n=1 Tax=Swingsia samuiensis TaxID=1293412 RepID=A0A4Y6UGF4_9PROT|nr:double-strand break repair helicase AddA [Swingsia samuiensis]QDH16662.1 double-strand break repair helicase AddA [Swingsia samuiensis]
MSHNPSANERTSVYSAREKADQAQLRASDPLVSAFVSASAGSGKTKLLIDRLLRLMLPIEMPRPDDGAMMLVEGANPARILCLTYTKAAAAEMANRLQTKLGEWVSLSDERLGQELERLHVPNYEQTRQAARSLFLKVLDLPGGLRIETIHAFCQSLLRRFPVEASVDPYFKLMEDTDAAIALREAIEGELAKVPQVVAEVAGVVSFDKFFQRVNALQKEESRLHGLMKRWQVMPQSVLKAYQDILQAGQAATADLLPLMCRPPKEEDIRKDLQQIVEMASVTARKQIEAMLNWLGTPTEQRDPNVWAGCLLSQKGEIRTFAGKIISKKNAEIVPNVISLLEEEGQRILDLKESIRSVVLVEMNKALMTLSSPILQAFKEGKSSRGLVDYNDLIQETRNLLEAPGAAWVLYKLDGGIDHLLLDEVQDNSRLQWEIAGALTSEFFAGDGAQEKTLRPRTVFAVGDYKQSIFGFQGAEPEQFHYWRAEFARRVQNALLPWQDPELNVSFRSVQPILDFVDAVFSHSQASYGLLEDGQKSLSSHVSARSDQGGKVEIWPLTPTEEGDQEGINPWQAPEKNTGQRSAPQRLAETLGEWITHQIGRPPQPGQRPLKAGDILILVPRRSDFLRSLIREMKTRDVPVATLVRVGLTEQVAVRDLMTLCSALLLPQDDLALASVLTSPLGGLTDQSLMDLATRDGTGHALGSGGQPLWTVLRTRHQERPEWSQAWTMLSALYGRVDYATPYRLLAEALGVHGGRTRLLRRLGPEAAEPVDELLSTALRYEELHPPSLQGFLHWLEGSDLTSKREPESDANAVRIMTVHGSKGLQARLVIIPDTVSDSVEKNDFLWEEDQGLTVPVWVPNQSDFGTQVTKRLSEKAQDKQQAERNRLLYVALTRASDWLVICGAQKKKQSQIGETTWYAQCLKGCESLPMTRSEQFNLGWEGEKYVLEFQPEHQKALLLHAKEDELSQVVPEKVDLPIWLGQAPQWKPVLAPHEEATARPLTPSRPDGIDVGEEPAVRSPIELLAQRPQPVRKQAMQRGTMVHKLLQVAPEVPQEERQEFIQRWLERPALGLNESEISRLKEQVMSVLTHPELKVLFSKGSRAEQPISGVDQGRVIVGQVDRLYVGEKDVWICDYKTNRIPPKNPERTPIAYVRQMALYRGVLQKIYPESRIHSFLVWTEGPVVQKLSEETLDNVLMKS